MCRYDDDYEWWVDSEDPAVVSDVDARCEDCGRVIPAGEPHTVFTAARHDDDDAPFVPIAFVPGSSRWFVAGNAYVRLRDEAFDNDEIVAAFEALGFGIEEVSEFELTGRPSEYHVSCNHCRAGNIWLREVCDQDVVLVTVNDLEEHSYEYPPQQLGPDFGTLIALARQQWRSKLTGELIPVHVVERLARDAAYFANAGNLVHDG